MACTYICANCNGMSGDHTRCPDCQFPRHPGEKAIKAMLAGTWPDLVTEREGGRFVQRERLIPVVLGDEKPMKLCKDCKFLGTAYRTDSPLLRPKQVYVCNGLEGKPSPIFGLPMGGDVDVFQVRSTICGWDEPKLFQPKEAEA